MKKSPVLLRQHLGWLFSKNWITQGKRKPIETGAEEILKSQNIPVYTPEELLKEKRVFEKIEVIGYKNKPIPLDSTHPDWHDRVLLSYKDHNVLLEGLNQAKIVTNTVEVKEGLPDRIISSELPKNVDKLSKAIILSSHLFDAEQKKLPIIKDPTRPAWNFPRSYGITQERRNKLMIHKLVNLIESISDSQLVKQRYIFEDLLFSFPFERQGSLVQLELCGNFVLSSRKPLSPLNEQTPTDLGLPDIKPIDPLITFNKENIYRIRDIYPINSTVPVSHPHTIFIHFDKEIVRNLYEEEVTQQQICGRSLLKTFTVAASYARQRFGKDVKKLEQPIIVQCVHTDGHFFHLGVFQLNTLDLEQDSTRNIWYQTPIQYLFDKCNYVVGKPTLEGYNPQIIRQLHSMYNSV